MPPKKPPQKPTKPNPFAKKGTPPAKGSASGTTVTCPRCGNKFTP